MKRKAHGAQEPGHIQKYVEVTSTAQHSDSPAQAINQRFSKGGPILCYTYGKTLMKYSGYSAKITMVFGGIDIIFISGIIIETKASRHLMLYHE